MLAVRWARLGLAVVLTPGDLTTAPCGVCGQEFCFDPESVPCQHGRPYCPGCAKRLNAALRAAGREAIFDERDTAGPVAGQGPAVLRGMDVVNALGLALAGLAVGWAVVTAFAEVSRALRDGEECVLCQAAAVWGPEWKAELAAR